MAMDLWNNSTARTLVSVLLIVFVIYIFYVGVTKSISANSSDPTQSNLFSDHKAKDCVPAPPTAAPAPTPPPTTPPATTPPPS